MDALSVAIRKPNNKPNGQSECSGEVDGPTVAVIRQKVWSHVDAITRLLSDLENAAKRSARLSFSDPGGITMEDIIRACADYYQVPPSVILGERRAPYAVLPRHVAMYLANELTLRSFAAIGRAIGGRDHSTVMNGVSKIKERIGTDVRLAADVETIKCKLVQG